MRRCGGDDVEEGGGIILDADISRKSVGEEDVLLGRIIGSHAGFDETEGDEASRDFRLLGIPSGENGLAYANSREPRGAFGGDEAFNSGPVISNGVEHPPAFEIEPRVIVASSYEIATAEFYVVWVKKNGASKLIIGSDFIDAIRFAWETNVGVFIATDEGVDGIDKLIRYLDRDGELSGKTGERSTVIFSSFLPTEISAAL